MHPQPSTARSVPARRFGWKLASALFAAIALPVFAAGEEPEAPPADTPAPPPPTIAVLPPEITLRELSAGGNLQERDDWSETARQIARGTLAKIRPEQFVYLRDLDLSEDLAEEIEEVRALYQAIDVTLAIQQVQWGGRRGQSLRRHSVGSVDRLLDAAGADALLVVYGVDDIFTTDRKALVALGMVASIVTSAYTGSSVMPQPSNGEAHLSVGLIARDGRLLWRNWVGQNGISDLRKPEGMEKTLSRLLDGMPVIEKQEPPRETSPEA